MVEKFLVCFRRQPITRRARPTSPNREEMTFPHPVSIFLILFVFLNSSDGRPPEPLINCDLSFFAFF
jgi:hypothetical protein